MYYERNQWYKSIFKCFKYRMYIIHIAIFEYQIYYCDYRLIRC